MSFQTKQILSNDKFFQNTGTTLTLSGETLIAGDLRYLVHPVLTGETQLADIKYVNDAIASVTGETSNLTANNGIRRIGDNLVFGGGLTGNTTISGNTSDLSFGTLNNKLGSFIVNTEILNLSTNNAGNEEYLIFYPTQVGIGSLTNESQAIINMDSSIGQINFVTGIDGYNSQISQDISTININSNFSGFSGLGYDVDYSVNFNNRSIPDVEWVKYWVSANTSGWKQAGQTDLTEAVIIDGGGNYLTFQNNYDFEILQNSGKLRLLGDGGYELIGIPNYGIDLYAHSDSGARGRVRLGNDTLLLGSTPEGQNGYADSSYITLIKFSDTEAIFRDNRTTKVGFQYYADYSANYTDRSLVDKAWVLSQVGGTGSTGESYWPLSGSASITGTSVTIEIPSGTTMLFSGQDANSDFTVSNSRINLEALEYSKINLGAGDDGWEIQMQSAGVNFNMGSGGVGVHLGTSNNFLSLSGGSSFSLQASNGGISCVDGLVYVEGTAGVEVFGNGEISVKSSYGGEIAFEDSGTIMLSGTSYGVRISESGAMQYLDDYSADYEARSLVDYGFITGITATSAINVGNGLSVGTGGGIILGGQGSSTNILMSGMSFNLGMNNPSGSNILLGSSSNTDTGSFIYMHQIGAEQPLYDCGIRITPEFIHVISPSGMSYSSDYSENFTDRSLVDKGYVDLVTSGITTYTAGNGLSLIGGSEIVLGGTVTGNTSINIDDSYTFEINASDNSININENGLNINSNSIVVDGDYISIYASTDLGLNSSELISLQISGEEISSSLTLTETIARLELVDKQVLLNDDGIHLVGLENNSTQYSLNIDSSTGKLYYTESTGFNLVIASTSTLLSNDSNQTVICNATSGITITLPELPFNKQVIKIKDGAGNALTHNITIDGNGFNIDSSSTASINTNHGSLEFMFILDLNKWVVISFVN